MTDTEPPAINQPILDPAYWAKRLAEAEELHHAIFRCPKEKWEAIERQHRLVLRETIMVHDSVLDAGCGWGRLLTLLPVEWRGRYLGVDISPDFIELAKRKHPAHSFVVGDITDCLSHFPPLQFDWCVLVSIRPMVKRNLGERAWEMMELNLRRVAWKLLYLEYDESDRGSIE